MKFASAPAKAILLGEHAVVYGQPAIAVPVTQLRAKVTVEPGGEGVRLIARDLGHSHIVGEGSPPESLKPLVALVESTLDYLGGERPALTITVESAIPIARGLGSGAAVSVALVRGLAAHWERRLDPQEVSALVYEAERFHHGTPSGIDHTVIAYGRPIYFQRGQEPQFLRVGRPFLLAIADSGVESPTKAVVEEVRQARDREPRRYEALFKEIGALVQEAKKALEEGELDRLGHLMDRNHPLLRDLGVSSPSLDGLVRAAKKAGAIGAKLSGAGQGGCVIALVREENREEVASALRGEGAQMTIVTEVS